MDRRLPARRFRIFAGCVVFSIAFHIILLYAAGLLGTYDFGAPVGLPPGVLVELAGQPAPDAGPAADDDAAETSPGAERNDGVPVESGPDEPVREPAVEAPPPVRELSVPREEPAVPEPRPASPPVPAAAPPSPGPLIAENFLTAQREKLVYQVSMYGLPIGTAELEAKVEYGEIRITLRTRSNSVFDSLYPVDNLVETRHISGRYLMANIRQREGAFRSEQMFTINLGKKRVTFADLLRGTSQQVEVPTDDILDTLSGIYFLRRRPLAVGVTETLHVFDSETYAEVPVEVLRREEVLLPNLTRLPALVIRPLQTTAGIFRRTGDLLIWLTDDAHRVPVRIMTTIELGRVTAELISAETVLPGDTRSVKQ